MKKIGSTWNGTGATVYLCLGFIPDLFKALNSDLTTYAEVYWDKTFRAGADAPEGYQTTTLEALKAYLTLGTGVQPYIGGETLSTTMAGTVTYGEGVYLKRDDWDYRYYSGNKSPGDAENTDIDTWTLDSSATYAGHFNDDVVGTYIAKGSPIIIEASGGRFFNTSIVSVTAATGSGASTVVLAYPVPSGKIRYIGGKYGFKPMIAGEITKAGVKCAYAFTNNDIISFIAERWD